MSAETPQRAVSNGAPDNEEDTFEKDLNEMLQDAPSLNDSCSTVQSGSPRKIATAAAAPPTTFNSNPADTSHTRPYTGPPATSNIPLSSPQSNGDFVPKGSVTQTAVSKIDTIRSWSLNTYKCTRQLLSEKFGKGSRTVDLELETQIEALRETQRKYCNILRLARSLTNHFYYVVQTQKALGESFSELAAKSPDLQEEFTYNSETQRTLSRNGEVLLGAMNFFTSSVNTLCNKTMEDTLLTIKQYENARLEYDAYRNDLEFAQMGPRDSNSIPKVEDAKTKFEEHKQKYESLRADVAIKLNFLEENKVKVMHKQLLLFHNAVSAYFSGNETALDATLKQFNIKLKTANSSKPSWIEQ
ncbi:arfaptin-2 isoform X2 [Octopus bimaculoides]|uniref:AH domain-containing protein n=1 Tax=Octopus bimaculoides TaxID=37653 RepID=A0A0L8FTV9_OCTBM|nr:arfaptin-2 isoform X2 [Octopus bimaculoides]|eukprot:XP_014787142.1 PREDICTED: arfaptin-2-like isoform X3 [Octopus bimaculoides]